jgi:hypothetical protein
VDAAAVLFESIRPLPQPAAGQADIRPPYHRLPGRVIVEAAKLAGEDGEPLLPSVAAETIVVDHGKIYLSEHLISACARLGISIQPGRVCQATGKGPLERWFRPLGVQLLAALPGSKGPDVYRRGKNPERQAFYFLDELETIIRRWAAHQFTGSPMPAYACRRCRPGTIPAGDVRSWHRASRAPAGPRPPPQPAAGEAPQPLPAAGSDDGRPGEPGVPFPAEVPGDDPGDFYADAMETV